MILANMNEPWPTPTRVTLSPLMRFKPGDVAYLRVLVREPCEGLSGESKVLVSVCDRFLRTDGACALVSEGQLISLADARKAAA